MWHRILRGAPAPTARVSAVVALAVLGFAACASTDDGAIVSTTVSASTAAAPGSAGQEPPRSEGTVEVGDTIYRLAVSCYAPGAGDLLVLGVGEDPDSDGFVEMYLQAFLGDPYIGLRLGDGTLLESSLDGPLDLYLQDDVIRASAIRFVEGLDLGTGEATEVGFGELEIFCSGYAKELPSAGS